MIELIFPAADESATERLGAALAEHLPSPAAVAISGPLGAGKTRLVRAIAAGFGIPAGEVISPTFVLCRTHRGVRTLHHLDAYRVRDEDEFRDLGVDELFADEAATCIEWAERVAGCLPDERLEIAISPRGETAREFRLRAVGAPYAAALDRIYLKVFFDIPKT